MKNEPRVTREWKRDGSTNEMWLPEAVANLAQNARPLAENGQTNRRLLRLALLRGREVHTPRAVFRVVERRASGARLEGFSPGVLRRAGAS